jgi:hypothetical protein
LPLHPPRGPEAPGEQDKRKPYLEVRQETHHARPDSFLRTLMTASTIPLDGFFVNAMISLMIVDRMKQQRAIPSQFFVNHSNTLASERLYLCFRIREFLRVVPVHQETDKETTYGTDDKTEK